MTEIVLVTGATGTTGRNIVEKLSRIDGMSVRAATRSHNKSQGSNNVQYVPFDYQDVSTIRHALQDVQKVFLVTPFVPDIFVYESMVIEQIKSAKVEHIVKLSVAGAGAKEPITLGKLHNRLEQLVQASGIAYTIFRPSSFMQNYSNFMGHTIRTQNAFYLPMGEGKVGIVDTRDIASVAVKALTERSHDGKIYTLTGPEALSNYNIADILSDELGRKISYVDISEEQARQGMKEAGMPDWSAECMLELYRINKAGHTADVSSDMQQIGVNPTSFRQFVRDFAEMFQ